MQRNTEIQRDIKRLQETRKEKPKETERYYEETGRHGKKLSGRQRCTGDTRQRQQEINGELKVENETWKRGRGRTKRQSLGKAERGRQG